MHVGDKIRKVRELKGYKQEYVADQLGMSVTAYGNLERGDSSPSYDRLEEIAKVLEVSVVDILNIPDEINIHSISSSNVIGFNHTLNDHRVNGDKETEGYKLAIDAFQKEVAYLKEQNRTLMELLAKK